VGATQCSPPIVDPVYLTHPALVDPLPQSSVVPPPQQPAPPIPLSSSPLSPVYSTGWINITPPSPSATHRRWVMNWRRMTLGTLPIGLSPIQAMPSPVPSTPPSISPPSWRTQSPPRGQSSRPTRTCTTTKCVRPRTRFRSRRRRSSLGNPMISWVRATTRLPTTTLPSRRCLGPAHTRVRTAPPEMKVCRSPELVPQRASESHRVSRRRCTEHALAAEPAGDHALRLCHL
jgi:hypothetical protein